MDSLMSLEEIPSYKERIATLFGIGHLEEFIMQATWSGQFLGSTLGYDGEDKLTHTISAHIALIEDLRMRINLKLWCEAFTVIQH